MGEGDLLDIHAGDAFGYAPGRRFHVLAECHVADAVGVVVARVFLELRGTQKWESLWSCLFDVQESSCHAFPCQSRCCQPACRDDCHDCLRCMMRIQKTLGLQIAQSRSYLCTLGRKVGIIYILGAPGKGTMLEGQVEGFIGLRAPSRMEAALEKQG